MHIIHGEFDNGTDNGHEILDNGPRLYYPGLRSIIRSIIQSPCIILSHVNCQIDAHFNVEMTNVQLLDNGGTSQKSDNRSDSVIINFLY